MVSMEVMEVMEVMEAMEAMEVMEVMEVMEYTVEIQDQIFLPSLDAIRNKP